MDVATELESRGTVFSLGADIVELEHYVSPAAFLKQKIHRCVMTYEGLDSTRRSFTIRWTGTIGYLNVAAMFKEILTARRNAEFRFGQLAEARAHPGSRVPGCETEKVKP